jgi:hypothetical protein
MKSQWVFVITAYGLHILIKESPDAIPQLLKVDGVLGEMAKCGNYFWPMKR